MVVWLASVAQAGVPVVFDGLEASEAVSGVAERTGLPQEQFDALPLDKLRQTPPEARGDAVLRRCATPAVPAEPVRTDFARARAAFAKGDRFRAMDYLDLAVAKIGCLSEVVDRRVAAQVFLFRGALTATSETGDRQTARGEIRTAIELVRDLGFPDWAPPRARLLFDEVVAEVEAADKGPLALLTVVPSTTVSGPWVDGAEVEGTVELRPGLHLLQYSSPKGIRSGWLSIGGFAEIVLPGQVRGPVLDRMVEPEGQQVVAAMVDVTVPDLSAAYVTHGGGLWLMSKVNGTVGTTEVEPPELAAAPKGGGKKKRKKKKNR